MAPAKSDVQVCDKGAKRRQKSREAARSRRQLESEVHAEICDAVPLPTKILSQMDRSAVMRLLISFIKLRRVMSEAHASVGYWTKCYNSEISSPLPDNDEYVNALNGFLLILSDDFDILYVSENITEFMGLSSLDITGQNLFELTHEGDHDDITKSMRMSSEKEVQRKSLFFRMKSTLMSSGRNVNIKSATYKVLKCSGIVYQLSDSSSSFMVAYCEPIPHPSNIEMVLDCKTFLSQHSLDMKFTYCDGDRVGDLLGYSEDDMTDKSLYEFCHTADLRELQMSMQKLFRLGQVTTGPYRMLAKSGGYVWLTTQATVINNPRNHQPSYVVSVHYVISGVMEPNLILSMAQMEFLHSNVASLIKQEVDLVEETPQQQICVQDFTDDIFCDITDMLFNDVNLDDTAINFTEDIVTNDILPSNEMAENLAQNAPSIGDEIDYSQLSFAEIFGIDPTEDECDKALSIGDTQWTECDEENMVDLFPDVKVDVVDSDRLHGQTQQKISTNTMTTQIQSCESKLPPERCQVIGVPKYQYQYLANASKRQMDSASSEIPLKKQKYMVNENNVPCKHCSVSRNLPDAQKLILKTRNANGETIADISSTGVNTDAPLLKSMCEKDQCKPCTDRVLSRHANRKLAFVPVLAVQNPHVEAPMVFNNLSTVDWIALSSALQG